MTLPESLDRFGPTAVLEALKCFEKTGVFDMAGKDAEIAEELLRCAMVRASVQSRFLLSDGEVRIRIQSQGLSVAGDWLKRVLSESSDRT